MIAKPSHIALVWLAAAGCACGDAPVMGTGIASARTTSSDGADKHASNTSTVSDDLEPQPAEAANNPVSVLPVFFLADGATLSDREHREYTHRVLMHLRIAQRFYLSQLVTETFRIDDDVMVLQSPNAAPHYGDPMKSDPNDDLGSLKVKEVLAARGEDRFTARHVFLILFVRPKSSPCGDAADQPACLGFGRPFSGGAPVVGGGLVEIDMSVLEHHETEPFQSTLAHELGHAFGMAHVDCHGFDLSTNDSIMSYNLAHHSHGYSESATPGILIPENFFVLSQNKGVFPNFDYRAQTHNPSGAPLQNLDGCYLGPMNAGLGDASTVKSQGFRLFYDGALVSGPETAYWTFAEGKESCAQNRERLAATSPETRVTCTFNGAPFDSAAP